MSGYTYLCSPYTHADPAVMDRRYQSACKHAARMMMQGEVVFSPIAHSHPIAAHLPPGGATDGLFWKDQDMPILRHASKLAVLMLDGWRESKGVAWEMEAARQIGLPIEYIAP
jgi:hypothetical protein